MDIAALAGAAKADAANDKIAFRLLCSSSWLSQLCRLWSVRWLTEGVSRVQQRTGSWAWTLHPKVRIIRGSSACSLLFTNHNQREGAFKSDRANASLGSALGSALGPALGCMVSC